MQMAESKRKKSVFPLKPSLIKEKQKKTESNYPEFAALANDYVLILYFFHSPFYLDVLRKIEPVYFNFSFKCIHTTFFKYG